MILRAVLVSLFVACLSCLPAVASQPEGLAGRLIANPFVVIEPGPDGLPHVTCGGFHWAEAFSSQQLDPTDTLTLEMAISPFRSSQTVVSLWEPVGSNTFIQFAFSEGLVNGVSYHRSGWNDVTVRIRPATQDYMLSVNGVQAGPFAYDGHCPQQGGCFAVQAFGIRGWTWNDDSDAWIDSVSLVRESPAGREPLLELSFSSSCVPPRVGLGGFLISEPPQRLRSRL